MFLCVLQGLTHARITFKDEVSGEYTYYELKLTSTAPAPVGQLVMECPCFSRTSSTISITNPMPVPVMLKQSCTNKQVRERAGSVEHDSTKHMLELAVVNIALHCQSTVKVIVYTHQR